ILSSSFAYAQNSVDITQLLKKITVMASNGDAEAAYHLGMIHINGIGVVQDNEKGLRWIKIAANKNDPLAAYELGNFNAGVYGEIMVENSEEAFRYKKQSAIAGYSIAQYDVGVMYLNYNNGKQGLKFLELAAAQGNLLAYQTISLLKFRGDLIERDLATSRGYLILLKNSLSQEEAAQYIPIIIQIEEQLSPEQVAQSDQFVTNWKINLTELSLKANKGLTRIYEHVGLRPPAM
ncbi:MAG: tetratricopeptide repeat protein, partial [Emcibacteraceae bacterium]|nr:tetratricopeptide repeat protein [Emcibacteraceae bacterium]